MMWTSNYKNFGDSKLYIPVSISEDCGRSVGYNGECYPQLAPKMSFGKVWHDNVGILSEEEINRYYIEEYYKQVLSKLNPDKIYNKFSNSILLSFEEYDKFCHRHIVAEWLNLMLDVNIPEVVSNGSTIEFVKRPAYIKNILREVIRENMNMHGFNSVRAAYLYNKGIKIEEEFDNNLCGNHDCISVVSEYYKNKAIIIEEEYNKNNKKKVYIK